MLVRALGIGAVALISLVPSCEPGCEPTPGPAPPRSTSDIVALVVEGVGSGDAPSSSTTPWTRIVDADLVASRYGLGSLIGVGTEPDPTSPHTGVWANRLLLEGSITSAVVSAIDFRGAYALPSAGFEVEAVTRDASRDDGFTFIGDSLGVSIADTATAELPTLLDGVFPNPRYDSVGGRCTADPGCVSTGLDAARAVPAGTGIVAIELGINDGSGSFAMKIDQVMRVLVDDKGVDAVVWLTSSTRSDYAAGWAPSNNARLAEAATGRWSGSLHLADWNAHSSGNARGQDGWFASDRLHLTSTGQAELARFTRDAIIAHAAPPAAPSGRAQ